MNAPLLQTPVTATLSFSDPAAAARVDAYVRAHADSTPFHLTAWSKAVERGCRQRSHYLVAERGGAVSAVLPLTEIRSKLFGHALVSAGFAVGGGIIADDPRSAEALAGAATRLAEALGCPALELRGGIIPQAGGWEHDGRSYAGFARSLAADDEAELLAIPRKQRAEVRRSLASDLAVTVGTEAAERSAHYAVYAESVHNLGTPVFPRALFDAVLDGFGGEADLLTVRHRGRPVASVLSLYFGGCVFPYWGGGTAEARRLRANDRMYFALMSHARARGCTLFDFGRSKPGTGAYAYKKHWGFEPVSLVYAARTAEGNDPRQVNPLDPRYRLKVAAWKRLPLWVANRLGPAVARGLG